MNLSPSQKDILERAGWTFVQAALAVLIIVPTEEWTVDIGRTALLAGVAAVLSLVKTVAQNRLSKESSEA